MVFDYIVIGGGSGGAEGPLADSLREGLGGLGCSTSRFLKKRHHTRIGVYRLALPPKTFGFQTPGGLHECAVMQKGARGRMDEALEARDALHMLSEGPFASSGSAPHSNEQRS